MALPDTAASERKRGALREKPAKKLYIKPTVTTFGSVAKLTTGFSGSRTDLLSTRSHGHRGHR